MTSPIVESVGENTKLSWENKRFYTVIQPALCKIGKPCIELCDAQHGTPLIMTFWLNGNIDTDERPFRQVNGFKYEACTDQVQHEIVDVFRDTVHYMENQSLLPASPAELYVRSACSIASRF